MSIRIILWLMMTVFPLTVMAQVDKDVKHKHWTKKYDHFFKKNSKRYFGPNFDWHLFKAQGIVESGLDPNAKSHVGAKGLMQIMPATYQEIIEKHPRIGGKIDEPRWNIAAAIYYCRQLYKRWQKKKVPSEERMKFTFASYNAGFNGVLKARKKSREFHKKKKIQQQLKLINHWGSITPFLPKETRNYIQRIENLMHDKPLS